MFKFLILAAVLPAIFADQVEVVPCWDGASPTPLVVHVDNCGPYDRCGTNQYLPVPFTLEWVAPTTTSNLRFEIRGRQPYFDDYIYHEIAAPVANPCNSLLSGSCPITAGHALTIRDRFIAPTKGSSFMARVDVEVRLLDDNNQTSTCAVIRLDIH